MQALSLAVAVLVLLAGCAGTSTPSGPDSSTAAGSPATTAAAATSSPPSSSSSSTPAPGTGATSAPAQPRTHTVNITGNQFAGGSPSLRRGDTVHWVHQDGATPHSVKADDGSFDSDGGLPCPGPGCMLQATKPTFDHTFDAAGSFGYHCEVHPGMKGTVTVA